MAEVAAAIAIGLIACWWVDVSREFAPEDRFLVVTIAFLLVFIIIMDARPH